MRLEEWTTIVDTAREISGDPHLPVYDAVGNYYNVCIPSIITPFSFSLWQLYRRINGTKNETFDSFHNLPAYWVQACDIIDTEIARIDSVRAKMAKREQDALIRKIGNNNKHGYK